jgi:hypothetical protein
MRLHASPSDYLLVLEFHDDVLVLEPSGEPLHADFFQVKTKREGQWKQRELLSTKAAKPRAVRRKPARRKGQRSEPPSSAPEQADEASISDAERRSILGKLLDHSRRFPLHVRTLNVVSNVTFDLELAAPPECKDRQQICLAELSEKASAKLKADLCKELGLTDSPPFARMFLHATGISLTEHEAYGAGKLAEFLEKLHPQKRFRSNALFRNLVAEVSRRAGAEWKPSTYGDVLSKGISRSDFADWIVNAVRDDPEERLSAVRERLNSEHVDIKAWVVLERAWRTYLVRRMDYADTTFQEFVERVAAATQDAWDAGQFAGLLGLVAAAEKRFVDDYGEPLVPLSRDLLKGAILYEFKVLETRQLQEAGAELAPEGK